MAVADHTTGAPVPTEADLQAFDALLANAKTLKLRGVRKRDLAWTTVRVDVDDQRDAFSILVNFDRDPAHFGKDLSGKEPYYAFVADVALGDGTDGRVVQTISNAGYGGAELYSIKPGVMTSNSMDRGETLALSGSFVPYGSSNAGCDGGLGIGCKAKEYAFTVERPGGSVRLAATSALNEATCRRAWCEGLCSIPTFCAGPVFCWACWAPPSAHYELQDASNAPLEGARYTDKYHTCFYEWCIAAPGGTGSFVEFGTAPLQARRDIVAALATKIAYPSVAMSSA